MAKASITKIADTSTSNSSTAKPIASSNTIGDKVGSTIGAKTGTASAKIGASKIAGASTGEAKTNPLDAALNKVTNREEFSYDPLKDANYQAMAKLYDRQGTKAAQDTMGDAAALNGGYGSSYAVTAAQQARNDYNQQLASQVPELQEAAYSKYMNDYNMDLSAYQALKDADDTAYNRNRDTVADEQWQQSFDQSVKESDRDFDYGKWRDEQADKQWKKEQKLAWYQAKKANGSRSGSSSRSSSKSGNGYVSGKNVNGSKTTSGATGNSKSNSSSSNPYYKDAANKAKNK